MVAATCKPVVNCYLHLSFSLASLSLIFCRCAEIMQASRGAVKVTIISAEALKKKQLDAIQAGILNLVGAGKSVDIVTEVNENILGGLQVVVGDKFLDLSVSSRVADLSKALESSA